MTYKEAIKIKIGDTVIAKHSNEEIAVVDIETDEQSGPPAVFLRCSDGLIYHHSAVI
jgi:hypothetical protein